MAENARNAARADAVEDISALRGAIERTITEDIQVLRGVVAYVRTRPDLGQDEYQAVAKDMLSGHDNSIRNIGIAKGMVISAMYPLAGNERAVGLDLRTQGRQWTSLQKAVEENQIVVSAPVHLVQGGIGIIPAIPIWYRAPNGGNGDLWGVATMVIDVDRFLKMVSLPRFTDHYDIALVIGDPSSGGTLLAGTLPAESAEPVSLAVNLPSETWTLVAAPKSGWPSASGKGYIVVPVSIGLFCIGALIVFFSQRLYESVLRTNSQLAVAKRDVEHANTDLERKVLDRTERLEAEIRERARVQASLQQNEEWMRQVAESASDWFWEVDENFVITKTSERFFDITGISRSDVIGQTMFDVIEHVTQVSPESGKQIQKLVYEHETFRDVDLPLQSPKVKGFVARYTGKPVFTTDGMFAGYRGTGREVTELKKAERGLDMFRAMFDASGQGLVVADRRGRLVFANAAYLAMLGLPEGFNRETFAMRDHLSARSLGVFDGEALPALVAEGRWTGELEFSRGGGHTVPTIQNLFVIPGTGGETLYGGVITDISSQRALLDAVDEAKHEADRANQAKSEFLSSMSHELRTPLNAIMGFAQLVQMSRADALSEQNHEYVGIIMRSGRHLLELINEVLDLARIEAGKLEFSLEPVLVHEALGEILPLVAPLAEPRGITIERPAGEAAIPPLVADYTRFKQVMLNLLSNAVKYNRENGTVRIDATVRADGTIEIGVSDTGFGIPATRQSELFKPFSRLVDSTSEIEGTGIGLVITKRIVEQMGGTIGFVSREGEGSRFWVALPTAAQPLPDDADTPAEAGSHSLDLPILPDRKTILYVEDNPSNIRLMEGLFSSDDNIRLVTAHTGELGLAAAEAERPDLILLDINLPGIDGFEVLTKLRTIPVCRATPVFAISANATRRDIEKGHAAGFTEYMTKPIDLDRLIENVQSYLS